MARKAASNGSEVIDRLPPYDYEAEKGILGCIFLDPDKAMSECLTHLRAGTETFYDLRHQVVFEACLSLYEARKPIDPITVRSHLAPSGQLEQVGGDIYLAEIANASPTVHAIGEYIAIVKRKAVLRRIIRLCTETVMNAYQVNGEAMEFLDKFELEALAIRKQNEALSQLIDIRMTQAALVEDYQNAFSRQSAMGIPTGYRDLDRMGGGLMEQEMIVLAGLRSTGKTSLAVNIAYNIARNGVGVGIFSLETSGKKIIHRLGCTLGKYDGSLLMRGVTTESAAPLVRSAFSRMGLVREKLMLSDAGPLGPAQIATIARRMYQAGARVFIVDYMQLINSPGLKEYERTTHTSRSMKNLAKELNCPVIVLSSLSRDSDKDNRRPRLSDLRASGQIEYDADKVWLLSMGTEKEEPDALSTRIVLDVAKNKDGPTGDVRLVFFKREFRIESEAMVSDQNEEML